MVNTGMQLNILKSGRNNNLARHISIVKILIPIGKPKFCGGKCPQCPPNSAACDGKHEDSNVDSEEKCTLQTHYYPA